MYYSTKQIILFILLFWCNSGTTYRILVVFPLPTPSHQRPQQAISKALADAGHEVVVFAPLPSEPLIQGNLKQINVTYSFNNLVTPSQNANKPGVTVWNLGEGILYFVNMMTEQTFAHETFQELLRTKRNNFDAIIIENYGLEALSQLKFEFPGTALIGVTSMEMPHPGHEYLGNPNHCLLHPPVWWPSLTLKELTFIERIKYLIISLRYRYLYWQYLKGQERALKKFFPHAKLSIHELPKNIDLAIECVSPVYGYMRPLLPNTKQIPFLHVNPPKPLSKDLQDYLDSNPRGTIYISFGSTIQGVDIDDCFLTKIARVLDTLDYNVIWKYESDSMPFKPKNVKILSWAPQADILAHKNIKLYIFQGGIQSFDESLTRGVPVLVIPFFSDQDKNAHIIETLGVGKRMFRHEVTEERLRVTINDLINNPKYKRAVEELRDKAWDMPMSPKESAVWWIEYAIRNRNSQHLKYKGRDLPFYQYYLLDVAGVCFAIIFVSIFIINKILKGFKSTSKVKSNKKED